MGVKHGDLKLIIKMSEDLTERQTAEKDSGGGSQGQSPSPTPPAAAAAGESSSPPPMVSSPAALSSSQSESLTTTTTAVTALEKTRKRKRLSAVLDKLRATSSSVSDTQSIDVSDIEMDTDDGSQTPPAAVAPGSAELTSTTTVVAEAVTTIAAVKPGNVTRLVEASRLGKFRAQLRSESVSPTTTTQVTVAEVFRFDSADCERYLCRVTESDETSVATSTSASSTVMIPPIIESMRVLGMQTPPSAPQSRRASPYLVNIPKVKRFSSESDTSASSGASSSQPPTGDSVKLEPPSPFAVPRLGSYDSPLSVHTSLGVCACPQCGTGGARMLSPGDVFTHHPPRMVSPQAAVGFDQYFQSKYLPDLCKRRCRSDSDLQHWLTTQMAQGVAAAVTQAAAGGSITAGTAKRMHSPGDYPYHLVDLTKKPRPLLIAPKSGSLESDTTSSPQDSPLDLSLRSASSSHHSRTVSISSCESGPGTPAPRFLIAEPATTISRSTGNIAPSVSAIGLHRTSSEPSDLTLPETTSPYQPLGYVCPICGQMFTLHDRLAKHVASRHRSKQPADPSAKSYVCEVCKRSFARSDMLTRHMRLHTGIKPYTCRVCGQVFSRSDHLSTHQRTHTGEKPYKCPSCPYAACRRDMITRHLRTHAVSQRFDQSGTPPYEQHMTPAAAAPHLLDPSRSPSLSSPPAAASPAAQLFVAIPGSSSASSTATSPSQFIPKLSPTTTAAAFVLGGARTPTPPRRRKSPVTTAS